MEKSLQLQIIGDFQNKCIGLSTGQGVDYEEYEEARAKLLSDPSIAPRVSPWISKCRFGGQFWSFIKNQSDNYQGRREFLWESIGPLFDFVEKGGAEPVPLSLNKILSTCNPESVAEAWKRIQERKEHDPEGAITASRTMLESTCKFILDKRGETYADKGDLPKLYKAVASTLNLSPSQHNEQIFKQILTGCTSVVNGMAALRNVYGDAHGKGIKRYSPTKRHADFAINLSGSICTFLIETYEENFTGHKTT
jgi:hypothetical protein